MELPPSKPQEVKDHYIYVLGLLKNDRVMAARQKDGGRLLQPHRKKGAARIELKK